jgi:hypothetical protein
MAPWPAGTRIPPNLFGIAFALADTPVRRGL